MAGGWIDVSSVSRLGEVGAFYFIVRTVLAGRERLVVRDTPAFTNRSLEPKLHGWCGETNNMATFAEGVVRVTQVAAGGERVRVRRLRGADEAAALRAMGYGDTLGVEEPDPQASPEDEALQDLMLDGAS